MKSRPVGGMTKDEVWSHLGGGLILWKVDADVPKGNSPTICPAKKGSTIREARHSLRVVRWTGSRGSD